MESLYQAAGSAIDSFAKDLHQISDEIWRNPETHFDEHHAHALLCDFLEKQGFSVERKYKLDTAFRARYRHSEGGPHVVVFCEYDALPGIGHGCGHNLIAEVGVATGIGIKAALEKAGNNIGELTVLGSPAEEHGGGKIKLIDAGALEGVDVALMSHPCDYNVNRFFTLAILEMTVTYRGRASHASCSPWDGVNALDAAVLSYQNISCLRQQLKPNCQIHGIITKGGDRPNIIPSEAFMQYFIRAPNAEELSILKVKVEACFRAAAVATGCTVEITSENPYLDVIINDSLIEAYTKHATKAGVVFETKEEVVKTVGGSTDMGNVSYVVPSIHPMFCIAEGVNAHTTEFTVASGNASAQSRTLLEAKLLAYTALDVFKDPKLLEGAKSGFQKDIETRGVVDIRKLLEIN